MTTQHFAFISNQDSIESEKKEFQEPRLKFIEPRLTKHGDATKITGQFFGTFNPRS